MPMTVLDALHSDLALARHDKGHAAKHDHPEPTPSEHPAAS
jgi:hypothetical protein